MRKIYSFLESKIVAYSINVHITYLLTVVCEREFSCFLCGQRELKKCMKLLDDYKHGSLPPGVSDREVSVHVGGKQEKLKWDMMAGLFFF